MCDSRVDATTDPSASLVNLIMTFPAIFLIDVRSTTHLKVDGR